MKTFHVLAVTVTAWLCATAFAQTPPDAASASALTQSTQLPPLMQLHYNSVFTGYQAFNDQPVAPWRTTNDTVEKIGGWRAYAKEAALPDAPPAHGNHGAKP